MKPVPHRLPEWFRQRLPSGDSSHLSSALRKAGVRTICKEALCPNANECFSARQATFLILGPRCTRSCSFCAVDRRQGKKLCVDKGEPERIARMVRKLGLDYVVITSVTRDDLRDGGAGQFSATIESIRNVDQKIKVEALIPDLRGDTGSLETLVKASPYVLAHNIETVKRLYPEVRPQADYNRSLNILSKVKLMNCGIITKSSLMLGMGESRGEVEAAMKDLRRHGCDCLTLGQYLAPSKMHYPVKEYISPGVFDELGKVAMQSGFRFVSSGPKVRSSYQAMDMIKEVEECMT